MKRTIAVLAAVVGLIGGTVAIPAGAQEPGHTSTPDTVISKADGTEIDIQVFKPGTASAENPAPVILHSHGWGGSKSSSGFTDYLDLNWGVVSITQRGHGNSGGEANVQDPTLETEDIKSVIDYVAELDWVKLDEDADGNPIEGDPVLGAIGGSYGGGYQTMTALDEIRDNALDEDPDTNGTRFNALSPEITWYDLNESLAPQKVVRTVWATALFAAGAAMLPSYVHQGFVYGAASGQWPDGTLLGQTTPAPIPDLDSEFHEHSPVAFVEDGYQLDIPVLLRQGASDNLFNLNQGLHIFNQALTDEARADSLFVGYNGGHVLPNALPLGTAGGSDACSNTDEIADWSALRIAFFEAAFAGEPTGDLLPARYNVTDVTGGQCHRYDETATLGIDVNDALDPTGSNGMITTAGAGAPIHLPLPEAVPGTKVAGIPILTGEAYAGAADTRVFFALSVGETPATAQVVQNNMMPLRFALPAIGEPFEIELPGVGIEVPEGQQLFLTISPVSDMSAGHGSRTPGAMGLLDLELKLPVLTD